MKVNKLIVIIVLIALTLCSCQDNAADQSIPLGTKLADSQAADFYFYYPDNWVADREDAMLSVKCNVSQAMQIEKYVTVSAAAFSATKYESLDEYWERYEQDIKNTYPNYQLTKTEVIKLTDKEVPSLKVEYTITMVEIEYVYIQVISKYSGDVYIITYTADKDFISDTKKGLDTIIKNFHFK